MPRTINGIDEIYNSAGSLLQPLGIGYSNEWERIERRAVSASSQEDFIFDESLYDAIRFRVIGIQFATDGDEFSITTSSNDGSTFDTGASDYESDTFGSRNQSGANFEISQDGTAFFQWGTNVGNSTGESFSGDLTLYAPDNTSVHKLMIGLSGALSGNATREVLTMISTGARLTTSVVNGVRFATTAASTFSGVIIMEGYRKVPTSVKAQEDWVIIDDQADLSAVSTHDVFWDDQVWDEIEITCSAIAIGTDNTNMEMQWSIDGSTFETGATDYEFVRSIAHSGSTTYGISGSTGADHIEIATALGTGTDEEYDITIKIRNVSRTDKKKRCRIEGEGNLQDALFRIGMAAGIYTAGNESIRGFRLQPASGTFSADRIRVRGRRLVPGGAEAATNDWEIVAAGAITDIASGANADIAPFNIEPYDELEFCLFDIDCDTTGNSVDMQLSADGGSTWLTSAAYDERGARQQSSGGTAENNDNQTGWQIINSFGSTTARVGNGHWKLYGFSSKSPGYPMITGLAIHPNDSNDATFKYTGGFYDGTSSTSTSINGIRLVLTAGGNWTAGRYVLRGRRRPA